MPINADQLAAGANKSLMTYAANDPVDQFTKERPFAMWLISKKKESSFGNGIFNEKVRITNDSNYQNFARDDQVSYNRKDTTRLAAFQHYEAHDGFSLNETDLADNGIILTDDRQAQMTDAESIQIINILDENFATLKDGFQENWDLELHRDGSQSTKAVPGLDLLVSTTPGSTTVGGIDCSVTANAYYKNNVSLDIAATTGTLLAAMEIEWRKCITYGKLGAPDAIFAGSSFLDAYAKECRDNNNYQVSAPAKGGVNLDGSRSGLSFKGIDIVWDPSFDTLQAADSATVHWDKRCYFLNSKALVMRPNRGRWLINRKPPRIYDRYTYYFGLTADYGLTTKQRNAMSVMSIA